MRAASERVIVALVGVDKHFGDVHAVDGVDLEVRQSEFFSLLGASGCGKTTLLRLIAGLDQPEAGQVMLDGVDMTRTPAYLRPVNTVFQSYALFPHMTVAQNVGFGLRQERLGRSEIAARVAETLALFDIEALVARYPHELSGGQRQRVALCRALVKRPRILLLDEPLAALDRRLREQARFELKSLQARLGITFIMVTHDQDEAMSLSSRVAVMDRGRILQVDTPRAIYDRPINRFVAGFVGDANFLQGQVLRAMDGMAEVDVGACRPVRVAAPNLVAGSAVTLMLRPERIRLAPAGEGHCIGSVVASAFLGNASVLRVRLSGGALLEIRLPSQGAAALPDEGTTVTLTWDEAAPAPLGD